MPEATQRPDAGLTEAFEAYDRAVTVKNIQVGCLVGMVLMPAGWLLDRVVYPKMVGPFLKLRLACALLIAVFWALVVTPPGRRHHRKLGLILALIPASFMSWMIHATQGASSPYYAGLNLVLLVVGFILHWTFAESLLAVALVMAMYLAACFPSARAASDPLFANNLYFMALTGMIVVLGSSYHSRLRFREFASRYQLDRSRTMLEASHRKLVELDRVKSRFFANISHELRTPLTLLLAPLESLLQGPARALDPPAQAWLRTMRAQGLRLLKLINDLLDLVRLESGKMEVRLEPVHLESFLLGLGQEVRKLAEDRGLALEIRPAPSLGPVLLDRDKLEKILFNLLFNAIKFTPAGGRIGLEAERRDDWLHIEVHDTGMGISAEQLPFLFERFWQADTSSRRKQPGAGIGLALVRELVEVQGGTIRVQSQLSRGTRFSLQLPCSQPADAPSLAPPQPAPSGVAGPAESAASAAPAAGSDTWLAQLYRQAERFPALAGTELAPQPAVLSRGRRRPRVLIADDEPDMLRFLRLQLEDQFEVVEAADGQQAVDRAAQFLPEAVLCDLMMPEKDGFQICQELRAKTSTQTIPVLLLTARADEETKLAALKVGASDFLSKPFSTTELRVRLANLVASHQLQRELARQKQILEATLEHLKDTEAQLVQSEKMASLGRLSAGLIHEINNPLNFAKTGLYLLRRKGGLLPAADQGEFADVLRDIEDGVDRVSRIVGDLRTFSHPQADKMHAVELEPVVEVALRFLSHEWKDGKVTIERAIAPQATVWANRNKLVQVLVNLLQNAFDAMRQKRFENDKPTVRIEFRAGADSSQVIVRDNGDGIPAELQPRVFEPFFTTKEAGEGMGLGLSICYRLMDEFGGRIAVRSQPGQYCEFTLEFLGPSGAS
jgi:signal transduction histidine kinase